MTKTIQSQIDASVRYAKKVKKKQVVINPELQDEAALLAAIDLDRMSFSERCKQLLKQHYEIKDNDMSDNIASGTIYSLREQYGLDSSAGIEQVEQAVLESIGYSANIVTTCKNNFYFIKRAD